LSFTKCDWFSTYRIQHRCTERFREKRCFLLGDAAHVHSPMGGQGMNTGLQDAYNLAWKLALVVSGRADDSLLDSYEAERMPVAQRLLATTDRGFQLLVSKTWLAGIYRTRIVTKIAALMMKIDRAQKAVFRGLSQTGIGYRQSPLSRTLDGLSQKAPRAGDRFPWMQLRFQSGTASEDVFERLDDTKFNLIVVGQPAPDAESFGLGDLLQVHSVAAVEENARALETASVATPSYYLLRPDGHVGLAGTRLEIDAVKKWIAAAHLRVDSAARQATVLQARAG
jgi:FAD binding domain-containing protein